MQRNGRSAGRKESTKYAVEGVIKDIIPIIDSVERATESTNESKDFDALSEGIQLIHKQLLDSLQRRNVNPIEAMGENFDPIAMKQSCMWNRRRFRKMR